MRLLPQVSSSTLRALGLAPLSCVLLSLGCSRDSETASLRALQPAGEVALLCMGRGPDGRFTEGLPRSECPDFEGIGLGKVDRHLMALVTQPASGEVALVDLAVTSGNPVIDYEPSQPGYSFLPIGAEPTSLVSTAGGLASFVAVRETGREGIFGLPTSCVGPRPDDGALRDVRTWPACRLPVAPGPMVLLNDPNPSDTPIGAAPRVRERCSADYVDAAELLGAAPAAARELCPVDLAAESDPIGRRKIAVTLPSLSEVWLLDAQELLDRTPGSFEDCVPEVQLVLDVATDQLSERIPQDLMPSSPSCAPVGDEQGPIPDGVRPWPVDIALDDDATVYIADSQAPLIHRLDGSDPCSLSALPALRPLSYTNPNALITTRKVAVSPLTPLGKRFVYAVDNSTTNTAGSLIPFDVSPGVTDRTPIVRERASFTPIEAPDRIQLPRDVADVEFAFQDLPEPSGLSSIAVEGVACDPDPRLPYDTAAARYRPRADRTGGARPTKLRGTFAFAALHSGQLAVVDVEDLDAACRRPISTNSSAQENLDGCKNDNPLFTNGFFTVDGIPTVSDEQSCNLVVPHRARSRTFFSNDYGTSRSAGLIAFPSLTLANGSSVTADQSDEGRAQPKLLGARHFATEEAVLNVGPLTYSTRPVGDPLELDPARAERSSVLLSYEEPRAYIPQEDFSAIFEGIVRSQSQALFRAPEPGASVALVDEGLNASFCNSGIQDVDLAAEVGRGLKVTDPAALQRFARQHADYVQITAALLEEDDPYWRAGSAGATCGSELFPGDADAASQLQGRPLCAQAFGPPEVPTARRDLRIVEASEDHLSVEPREDRQSSPERRNQLLQFVSCCFPKPSNFLVRAANQWVVRGGATGVGHHVTTDPTSRRCVNDCNPLNQRLGGRVLEISCSGKCPLDAQGLPAVGLARAGEDVACVVDDTSGGIDPGEPGSECVFQSLTTRFAIYRGLGATARDTRFRWVLSDGFAPLTLSLATGDRSISSPRSLLALPELGQMLVTDGTAAGLIQVQISSSSLSTSAIY